MKYGVYCESTEAWAGVSGDDVAVVAEIALKMSANDGKVYRVRCAAAKEFSDAGMVEAGPRLVSNGGRRK
jgi:hypothetical protein